MTHDHPPHDDPTGGHPVEDLSALLDGELGATDAALVRAHLVECEPCADELESLRLTRDALGALPLADGSAVVDGFVARHRQAVRTGATFVGAAMLVIGALALTASVSAPSVVPDLDALVAAHGADDPGIALATAPVPEPTGIFDAPEAIDAGLARRVVYGSAETTAVVYDGADERVSVFQQYGRVRWSALAGGSAVTVDGRRAWRRAGDPVVIVAESGHLVLTVVASDEDTAMRALARMPAPERSSRLDRLHDACQRLTEVFGLAG